MSWYDFLIGLGEVSEWSKEHAWKVCMRKRIEGSNPSLTAISKTVNIAEYSVNTPSSIFSINRGNAQYWY